MTLYEVAGAAFANLQTFRRSSWSSGTPSLSLSCVPYPVTQDDLNATDWVIG